MPSQRATSIIICVGRILLSIEQIINVCGPGGLKAPQDEGLAEAFPGVLEQLPITQRVLDALKARLNESNCDRDSIEAKESYPSILQLVGGCNTRATKMESIYQAVVPGDTKGRELLYRQSTSGDETVEVLMKEMLASMLQVADSPLLLIGESERKDLEAALEAVKRLAPSLTEEEKSGYVYNITNSGSGLQPVHSGRGHQHIYGHNLGGTFPGVLRRISTAPGAIGGRLSLCTAHGPKDIRGIMADFDRAKEPCLRDHIFTAQDVDCVS